jgi:endonuclease/exonuclease/phosphatase family metal-dependent hydrolase
MAQSPRQLSWHLGAALLATILAATRLEAADPCVPLPVTHGTGAPHDRPSSEDRVAVASLNTAGDARIADPLAAWIRERGLDLLLLQEVGSGSHDGAAFAAALSARLGYHFAYAPAQRLGKTETQGIAILSSHPLTDVRTYPLTYHRLRFRSRCRIGLAATLQTTHGPVHVMNVHLDTRINSKDRLAQLEPLLTALAEVDGPTIIGGDFNTMNIKWFGSMWPIPVGERQTTAVRTRLGEHGFHTPSTDGRATVKFFGLPFRLDWIYLKGIQPHGWTVDDIRFTDHRGVWTSVPQVVRPRSAGTND